jgi:hypothetical protein
MSICCIDSAVKRRILRKKVCLAQLVTGKYCLVSNIINRSGISKKNPGVFEHQQHIRLLKMFHGAEKKGVLADA